MDSLLETAYRYLSREVPFDDLYGIALERIVAAAHGSAEAQLAELIVAVEAEYSAGQYSAGEAYGRIVQFITSQRDPVVREDLREDPTVVLADGSVADLFAAGVRKGLGLTMWQSLPQEHFTTAFVPADTDRIFFAHPFGYTVTLTRSGERTISASSK